MKIIDYTYDRFSELPPFEQSKTFRTFVIVTTCHSSNALECIATAFPYVNVASLIKARLDQRQNTAA